MTTVHVALPGRAYDIHIGAGLLEAAPDLLRPHLRRPRLAVVTEERVAAAQGEALRARLAAAGIETLMLVLPPGEGSKDWATLGRTVEWLLEQKVERNDLVLAFGGGVIGDLAGFAAAILRRGVRFAQMPTTLLAQVDSSVGGKTGINTPQGKNLVGAFHQPVVVIADPALLSTLPHRDLLSGYGEVVKYGLLGDAAFFGWLEAQGPHLLSDPALLEQAVVRSCEMKARIVERDETETGERALLNLGHTFAHALEAATGYSDRLLHGEAVAVGLGLAFDLSARLGLCAQEEPSRIRAHLQAMGMKARLSDIPGPLPDPESLLALMAQDKKAVAGRLRFVLARGIGQAFVTDDVPQEAVIATLRDG
ncbi:3-dehydroquinate synthase [Rubellimicrobium thermophilum DSM 16684]|uniref:3-dehydroquinate synthase n=1 Tax=Rubellimicrobium thermophilum DSM 16684 TaxID=1123069 RepID=S9R2Q2_9RHOB|nr:3-dehydroquinate synthase [Rubellimicrobium thermophilum]EPX86177.1 3-dehydroquinate synthase [Rubellimicrobium thermophilum DSM 16684]